MMALDKTFAAGDVLSAGDVNGHLLGLWIPIDKRVSTSGAPVTSVSFQSIDSNFRIFRITFDANCSVDALRLRLNNDTGANYNYQYGLFDGTSVTGARSLNQIYIPITQTTGVRNSGHFTISKPTASQTAVGQGAIGFFVPGTVLHGSTAGVWNNTSALINRIDVFVTTGNFYGVVALEGMRGV